MKKLLRTKKDKEQFLTWVAFLKAGVFKKGKLELQNNNGGYCCLGVGCVLTIPEHKIRKKEGSNIIYGIFPDGDEQKFAPLWLQRINDDSKKRIGTHLNVLNDGNSNGKGVLSHSKIADKLLEVYGHEL